MALILASSSVFRQTLLQKLGLEFTTCAPNVDESRHVFESPCDLVLRLAGSKAYRVAKTHSGLIIASDQVATLGTGLAVSDNILTKPHTHQNAVKQLQQSSGKWLTFCTSLALLNTNTNNLQITIEKFQVLFKPLTRAQIENYLIKEKPYQCAGSFKSEGLGIALFERFLGNDPNSLVGLPLILLIKMLKNEGVDVLGDLS